MQKVFLFISLFFLINVSNSQQIEWSSSRILLEIEKLNTTGSVLYIAAHPDDENTRLIAYLANEKKVRTGYLSLTRGDGGQNLVGEEQGAYLGVIRTQELMAARKIDGGEQFFTRAVDFGYSKSADETYSKWPHDSLLADVVWVIRNFKPDIIITRFPPDERAGHGQHTVSALIAEEAFDAAADPTKFPEQLKYVSIWQSQRLFWNTSLRWDDKLADQIKNGDKNIVSFDVGGYNVLLGKSYGEIAADSRTNHKSQGFGSSPTRGEQTEYLYLNKGNALAGQTDLLAGVNISWERYRQGSEIKILLEKIIGDYNVLHPEKSVDQLLKVYTLLEQLPEDKFINFKKQQIQNILVGCLGLWFEPVADNSMVSTGDKLRVISTSLKRNEYPISLESIQIFDNEKKVGEILPAGRNQIDTFDIIIPENLSSSPYWLDGAFTGMFNTPDQLMIGKAENDAPINFIYNINIGGISFPVKRELFYKETDAVKGELYSRISILPVMEVKINNPIMFLNKDEKTFITIPVKANRDISDGELALSSKNILSKPASFVIEQKKGETKNYTFEISFGENGSFEINPSLFVIAKVISKDLTTNEDKTLSVKTELLYDAISIIKYDHIPTQVISENATIKAIQLNSFIPTKKIAYVEGAGDKVDESLDQLGLNITTIKPEQITAAELNKYDAVIIGVRAYNTSKPLADNQQLLMNYVENGGLVITQYSTNWDLYTENLGPYPFKIKRGRVTDENSPVDILLPDHPVLNVPNKITQEDFKGWIQERGIYFAEDLAPEYKTPLAFTDPGEQPQNGSLIIADYGKGAFIYTGIAFFRELPAGVPGAYRLFVNLLSYENPNN